MQPRTALLVIAHCVAAASAQPEARDPMSAWPDATTLPAAPVEIAMDMSFGKPAVEVMINGEGPYKLLIDTGAAPTLILNSDLAEELGLETIGASAVGDPTDPGAIEVETMRVESVHLGGAEFRGIETISWDRSTLYAGRDAPRGILGFPLFHDVLVTFDYPGGVMRVEGGRLEPGPHVIAYEDERMGVPEIHFALGDRSLVAHLDSGSMASTMLPLSLASELPLGSELAEISRARTVNSEFPIYAADYAGSLTLAGHEIRTEQLMFTDLMPDANIGSQVLGQFAVTFDQHRKLVRFARQGEGPVTVERQRGGLGLMLGKRGDDYIVSGTVPDSLAAAAGLREGDVIVAVNGKPIGDLPPGDLAVEMRKETVELTVVREGETRTLSVARADQ